MNVRRPKAFEISTTQTFSFPKEAYPLRELLGALGSRRDTGDEAKAKLVLVECVRTLRCVAIGG